MKHLFVINPISFPKKREMNTVISNIRKYFSSFNDSEYNIYISKYPRDAVGVVKKFAKETDETVRVHAIGGDGIVFDCLNGMVSLENAELAVMPYGSDNDFIYNFGNDVVEIFRNVEKQVEASTTPMDVISFGSRYAVSYCSAGLEAAAISKYYSLFRRYPKLAKKNVTLMYMFCAFMAILDKSASRQEYEITIDGVSYDGKYATIIAANNACYAGGRTPAPMAHPADGFLDIVMVKSINRLRLINFISKYLNGQYFKYPSVFTHVRGKQISIRAKHRMFLNTDGESFYDNHIEAKIVPHAIRVAAPDNLEFVIRRELK